MTPTLSLILCSRNDDYMGNARWRLETTLNYVSERVEALGRDTEVELLVTDWGSEVPLSDVVALGPAAADRKSTRLNSSHSRASRMPSSA